MEKNPIVSSKFLKFSFKFLMGNQRFMQLLIFSWIEMEVEVEVEVKMEVGVAVDFFFIRWKWWRWRLRLRWM